MEGEDFKKKVKKEPKKTNLKKSSIKTANIAVGDKSKVQKYKLEKKKEKINISFKNRIQEFNKKHHFFLKVIIVIMAIAVVIYGIVNMIINLRYSKYDKYGEKMNVYGLTSIYDNNRVSSREFVTKLEGIKLALSTMLNTNNILGFAKNYNGYEGETWVKYAEFFNILSYNEINKENKDEVISYIDLVKYFYKAKEKFTEVGLLSGSNIVLKNAAKYDTSIQVMFSDFVENKIIELENSEIDAEQKVFKGLANELVINSLEKFNLISIDKERLRITQMPNNEKEYPYILFDIDQKVYDYDFVKLNNKFVNPKNIYSKLKDSLEFIKDTIENYFENLYSVDYKELKSDQYKLGLLAYSGNDINQDQIKEYCDMCIKNKVITDTKVKFIEPCIYYDGESYRARIKIDLKIISSDTKDNILFGDSEYRKNNL